MSARLRGVALGLSALLMACGPPPPQRETLWVFGSRAEIELRGVPDRRAAPVFAEIAERLNRRHRQWHAWEESDLTRLNAALARGETAPAPESILNALRRVAPLVERSDGLFDPVVGGLVALWGFHRSEFPIREPPPDPAAIAAWLAERPRFADLAIGTTTIASRNRRAQIDLAAIAEGLAAAEIAAIFAGHAIEDALIALGGDVYALGTAGGRPWRVALRDPLGDGPDAVLASVELAAGEALFVAGGYQRYREDPDGGRWPHLLDPRTGEPARASAGSVVLHPDPVTADAAATALFVAGPDGFATLTASMGLGCALLLDHDDRLHVTTALAARLEWQRTPTQTTPLDRGPACAAATRPTTAQ